MSQFTSQLVHPLDAQPFARSADLAAQAIFDRYVRTSFRAPGARYPRSVYPPKGPVHFVRSVKNYWWAAHLIDCAIDKAIRTGSRRDRRYAQELVRGLAICNNFSVINDYYDDMAWFALALQRGRRYINLGFDKYFSDVRSELASAWSPQWGGGMRWRKTDVYFNVPSGATIGIFQARMRNIERAAQNCQWLENHLYDKPKGLITDGVHVNVDPSGSWSWGDNDATIYTYNQGTMLGLELELLLNGSTTIYDRASRIEKMVSATYQQLTTDGVIHGSGAGDGGLFAGILSRYIAQVALAMPKEYAYCRDLAATMIKESAVAALRGALHDRHGPLFSDDWNRPATAETPGDLSIQLSSWLVLEAAALLQSQGII